MKSQFRSKLAMPMTKRKELASVTNLPDFPAEIGIRCHNRERGREHYIWPIWLPASMLAQINAHPPASYAYLREIFVACPHCNRVYGYKTGEWIHSSKLPDLIRQTNKRSCSITRVCGVGNCKVQLEILTTAENDESDEQVKKHSQRWLYWMVRCPKNPDHLVEPG